MKKSIFLFVLVILTYTTSFSQCEQIINLNNWTVEGGNSNWVVNTGGTSVTQTINGLPTFFVSDFNFINVQFSGDFTVGVSGDNDFVGFVLGYKSPYGTNTNDDFYLFATVKDEPTPQTQTTCENFFGYFNGDPANLDLWTYTATAPAYINTLMCDNTIFPGWVTNQTYHFTCEYTSTHIVIKIDGVEVVNVQGCFQPGRFGFYNNSQDNVTYSNFKYKIISDFDIQSDTVCVGDTAKYSLFCNPAFQTPYMTTIWDMGDGQQYMNMAHPEHVYQDSGVYQVQLKVEDINGCADSITKSITVFDPRFDIGVDTAYCMNEQDNRDLTVVMDRPNSYLWSTGETTQTINVNQSGTYSVIGENIIGCKVYDTIQLTFNPKPNAGFSYNDTCFQTPVYLSDTSVANAASIANRWWYLDNAATVYSTSQDTSHVFAAIGTHPVQLIVENSNGCYDTILKQIAVYPIPQPQFSVNDACLDDVFSFTDQSTLSSGSIASWDWNFGDGSTSTTQNPNRTYADEGIYAVKLVVTSNYGCKDSVSNNLTAFPLPKVGFESTFVCLDSLTQFTDTSTISNAVTNNTITTWNWDFGDGYSSAVQSPSYQYGSDGTFNVTLTATSNNGCDADTTLPVTVYPNPTVVINGANLSNCVKVCAELGSSSTVTAPSTITSYLWNLSSGDFFQSTSPHYGPCFETLDEHDLSIDVALTVTTNHGCKSTDAMYDFINVYHKPIADFEMNPDTPNVLNPIVDFENQSQFADNYYWDFGGAGTSIVENPSINFLDHSATYNVVLIASTVNGCADTATNKLTVESKIVFYVPNSFTPDGEGVNNVFLPIFTYGFNPEDYHLAIFNRWGEMVFESRNVAVGWDGTYNGKIAPSGAYIWKIDFGGLKTDERQVKVGHVNLLK